MKRHREESGSRQLRERGVPTYLPLMAQWPRPSVGSAIAPIFPGYLFAHLRMAEQLHQVMRTPGVRDVVSCSGSPVAIDPEIVACLRARESPDGVIACGEQSGPVRIVDGPLRGLTAVLDRRLPARDRVFVLMSLLQREVAVELPDRWVRQS